jgi:transposase
MNTSLHALIDTSGHPILLFITEGQVRDYTGAAVLMKGLHEAEWLLSDRWYDAEWFRETLIDKGANHCIPNRRSRKQTVKHDNRRYKRRNRIERMFRKLKAWRPISTCCHRLPIVLLSAIALPAAVILWF